MVDMEVLMFMVVVALILLFIALPLLSVVLAILSRRCSNENRKLLDRLSNRITSAEMELQKLRISLEGKEPGPQPPPLPPSVSQTGDTVHPASARIGSTCTEFRREPAVLAASPSQGVSSQPQRQSLSWPSAVDWEHFFGVKFFAWAAGLALFLGVGFFLKWSFERGLITPPVRVALGFIAGVGLTTLGLIIPRKRYTASSQALMASGIVIFYTDIYAACLLYGFVTSATAFLLMVGVTIAANFLAACLEAPVIAVLGLLGGFLTPPLLSTGVDRPWWLFGYAALLNVGLLTLVLRKRWYPLALLSAVATVATQFGWVYRFFTAEKMAFATGMFLVFCVLYVMMFVTARARLHVNGYLVASVFLLPISAYAFAFHVQLAPYTAVVSRPALLFLLVFGVHATLLVAGALMGRLRILLLVASILLFWQLAWWTGSFVDPGTLAEALLVCMLFGVLHILLPVVSEKRLDSGSGQEVGDKCGERKTSEPRCSEVLRPHEGALTLLGPVILPFLLLAALAAQPVIESPSPVLVVAAMFCALLFVWSLFHGIGAAPLIGLIGIVAVQLVWHVRCSDIEPARVTLVWSLGFYLVLGVFPFLFRKRIPGQQGPWLASALVGPIQFLFVYQLVRSFFPNNYMGLVPAAFVPPSLLALLYLNGKAPSGLSRPDLLQNLLVWVTLFFVTLIFPIQFEKQWLTIGWAVEGVALLWLAGKTPYFGLKHAGVGLLASAFVRLALNPAVFRYYPRTNMLLLNWYLYTYTVVAICLFLGVRLLARPRHRLGPLNLRVLLGVLGTVLAFLLVNIEIADAFSSGPRITFRFSDSFARDMTYSLAWGAFAFTVLFVGILKKVPLTRYGAIGLLIVTLVKLFLHDIWRLGGLFRIGALIGLAAVLVPASLLYARFLSSQKTTSGAGTC